MALVGTFGPDNTYSGRNVTWDAGVFTVEGLGEMSLDTLRESQAAGQFTWTGPETQAWAEGLASTTFFAESGPQATAVTSSAGTATPREPRAQFRVKPWMAAAVVGLIVVAGVAMALAGKPPAPGGGDLPGGGGGGGKINHAPVASDDSYTTAEGTQLTVSAAEGLLANDTDPDSDALSVGHTAGPAHGTMTVDSAGSFAYTPPVGFSGADFFTYEATDGRETRSALVNITVTPATGGGGGKGGNTDPTVVVPPKPKPVYTKHIEIKASVILISIPVIGPYGTMYSYHYNCEFYAAGLRTHIVEVGKSEMKTLAVHKTKGRASLVNGLVKKLKNAGWTVTGKGRFWYSIKLSK